MSVVRELNRLKNKFFQKTRHLFDEHPMLKFLAVVLVITAYFLIVMQSHGLKDGLLISILTWSFFVLSTPIADAGILLDLPLRIITGLRMIYAEVVVWTAAIVLNLITLNFAAAVYEKTFILSLFEQILTNPLPYWSIIILSGIGTFFSIYIADEIVDPQQHHNKYLRFLDRHKLLLFVALLALIVGVYKLLLNELGIEIPLF